MAAATTTAWGVVISSVKKGAIEQPRMDADEKQSGLQATALAVVGLALPLQGGDLAATNHLRLSASIGGQKPSSGRWVCVPNELALNPEWAKYVPD